MAVPPWAEGPREVLEHGLELLERDSDSARRLAMLAIDNAVELTIKTYLSLPKRITGLNIQHDDQDAIKRSWSKMLDALEKHASEKLGGISLQDIDWYHRLRNHLYHDGNGVTVARTQAALYAELARSLWTNLFDVSEAEVPTADDFLREFVSATNKLAAVTNPLPSLIRVITPLSDKESDGGGDLAAAQALRPITVPEALERIDPDLANEAAELERIRSQIIHGEPGASDALTPDLIERVNELTKRIRRERLEVVKRSLARLPPLEQQVVVLRYGFATEPMSLEETGRSLGLTVQQVREIETQALRHLASSNDAPSAAPEE